MAEPLIINGKKYFSSSSLSSRFGYTSDYIAKLARDEKILGTQMGRLWFVEPESLNVFLTQAKIAKEMRQEELRSQRKIERQLHRGTTQKDDRSQQVLAFSAFSQTVAIVLCGLLVATLYWSARGEGVGIADLALGAKESAALVVSAIAPELTTPAKENIPTSTYVQSENQEKPIFTTLPEFPVREPLLIEN